MAKLDLRKYKHGDARLFKENKHDQPILNQRKRHGWMYVCNELISETAPTIFLKLGMKFGDNKGKKIARPDF